MSYESPCFWVVLCKNHKYHKRQHLFSEHKIPLGEADAYMPPPALDGHITVRCDDCGQEYTYKSKDLVRYELELPDTFVPHPAFAA
jgi:hypothetical protein